jgi:hypothetical protein
MPLARSGLSNVYRVTGRRAPARTLLRIAPSLGVAEAKIVLSVLVQILGGNPVAARRGFPCQSDVPFEDLLGSATDPDIGAVAVKCLIVSRTLRLLSEWSV